jgi:hypothetical protein
LAKTVLAIHLAFVGRVCFDGGGLHEANISYEKNLARLNGLAALGRTGNGQSPTRIHN